jgi:hypothetical protein
LLPSFYIIGSSILVCLAWCLHWIYSHVCYKHIWLLCAGPSQGYVCPSAYTGPILSMRYKLHGQTLKSVNNAKYLGCLITSDLRWTNRINSICGKANKTLGFQRRNLNIGSTTTKQNAYNSLVRPIVEYASTVWDPYTQKDIRTLEMVQRRGARYVCNKHGNRSSVALPHMLLMWFVQRRSDVMRQPRYFSALFTDFRVWPCSLYSNLVGLAFLLMASTLHLSG